MSAVRIAVILMTLQRYLGMVINFVMVAVVSRLLRPEEIGLAVIGSSIGVMLLSGREFAALNFLVQRKDLTKNDVRVAFSIFGVVTIISSITIIIFAPWIAIFYNEPVVVSYLRVVAMAALLEAISAPILSLMQRDMAFKHVAYVSSLQMTTAAIVTVTFAATGFGTMSYAWAWLISAAFSAALALYLWGDISVFKPTFKRWREMLVFGGYTGTNVLLSRIYETIPSLILGHTVSKNAVGFMDRAKTVCDLPEKIFLSGFFAVSLSAFSAQARETGALKAPYLQAFTYITALQWPALICISILAHPIVAILLGSQWEQAVPIVQIMALAFLFSFSFGVNFAVLTALGAVRAIFLRAFIVWPISAVILSVGAFFSIKVMVLLLFVVMPFQAYVAIQMVRLHVVITWGEMALALRKSLIVTLFSAIGPLAMIIFAGMRFDISIFQGVVAGAFAGLGWLVGLWLTQHPLFGEIVQIVIMLKKSAAIQKLFCRNKSLDVDTPT